MRDAQRLSRNARSKPAKTPRTAPLSWRVLSVTTHPVRQNVRGLAVKIALNPENGEGNSAYQRCLLPAFLVLRCSPWGEAYEKAIIARIRRQAAGVVGKFNNLRLRFWIERRSWTSLVVLSREFA